MKNDILSDEAIDKILIEYMPKTNILLDQLEEERDKDLVPHVFSRGYKRNIKRIIKEYSRTPFQKRLFKLRRYVAVILALFILTNGVLIATAEGYRERVFNAITNIYEKFTSIVIDVEEPLDTKNMELNFIKPSYIPDGFQVIDDMRTGIARTIDYMNEDYSLLMFNQSIITSGELRLDTEDTIIKEIKVNNQTIEYFFNKDTCIGYWNDSKYRYLVSAEVSFEEFVKILEGIIKK